MRMECEMGTIERYNWYQCDIVCKSGKRKFWCRFVATDQKHAEEKIIVLLREALTGNIKNLMYQILYRFLVDDFDIFQVPVEILEKYDFLKTDETLKFYKRVRG